MEYKVKITPYALRQMQEIVRYISATLQSPENAARWLDTIKAELASLSSMPATRQGSSNRGRTLAQPGHT